MDIAARYTPADIEDKWYAQWEHHRLFHSEPDEREPYTIVIPPPNVTGVLHMGHMLNNTIQDVLIRRRRMEGYNACWVPGTDHASIATEAKVVRLLAEQGIQKRDISREEFLQHAYAWKDKYGGIILQQLRKLGASCDWERTRFTMDENYYREVIRVFCDLFDKGYIYRGVRMVNWDPSARTAVSDEEVIRRETRSKLVYVKYLLEGSDSEYITVATVRPETIMGDVAVAVHPEDERFLHLHGRRVMVPLVNRAVPVIADAYVDREFGAGCLKVTPAHDLNDYEIGLRHNLPVIDVFNEDGTISEAAQVLVGMERFAARKKAIQLLQEAGLVEKIEDYVSNVGYSERTDAAIEPRLSLQWFLKMQDLSQPALSAVLDGDVSLIPAKFVNTYRHWMENVRDWCLSRQLWWGHRIPAYYIRGNGNDYVVAETAEAALEKARAKTGDPALSMAELSQDEDVLDTWASSWLWPISVFNGISEPENPEIRYYYPTNDLVTAPEILFFWVARMMIAGYEYRGQRPFRNVYLTGIVRDKQGRKMSKSLGNSPDALELIAQYGADGVRMGMLLCSPAGNDLLFDEKLCEQGRNFCNKVWNAYRLVKGWESSASLQASATDRLVHDWMRARIAAVGEELQEMFRQFRLSEALMAIYKLIWDDFCAWYLEWVKPAYGEPAAQENLEATIGAFEALMQILHPFMPFISEEIWQGLRPRSEGEFLCIAAVPAAGGADSSLIADMERMQTAVTALRKFRADKQLSPKTPIALHIKTATPALFENYRDWLGKFLNLSEMQFIVQALAGAHSLTLGADEFFVPLESEAMDPEAERQKIEEEIRYTEGFLQSVQQKLSNSRFVENAKPDVVEREKQKLTDAEARLSVLRGQLQRLAAG